MTVDLILQHLAASGPLAIVLFAAVVTLWKKNQELETKNQQLYIDQINLLRELTLGAKDKKA